MASASESAGIQILSWNINGLKTKLKDERKKNDLFNIFNAFDIVLLQETNTGEMKAGTRRRDDDRTLITRELTEQKYECKTLEDLEFKESTEPNQPKTIYMTHFESNSKGVAILINKPHKLLTAFCEGGDCAWVHVEIDDQKYTFVSVYCRGRDPDLICDLMMKIFYSFLKDGSNAFNSRLVIGGDFNTTLDSALDATKEIPGHAARRKRLNRFMSITELSDVWREKHSRNKGYTYHHYNGTKSRLDYVFMLQNDVDYVEKCDIRNNIKLSYHFPVSLTLNMNRANTYHRNSAPEE